MTFKNDRVFGMSVHLVDKTVAGYDFGQNISSAPNIIFERQMMTLVILQIGLVRILKKGGVPFCAAIGHSYGEIAASYASDVISLREVLSLEEFCFKAKKFHTTLWCGSCKFYRLLSSHLSGVKF
jgi:hypothetical protein